MVNEVGHVYNVRNLIKHPTCHKSTRGTLLDPVIVSNKNRFSTSFNLTCGFSDFLNLVGCVTKLTPRTKKIFYRTYKHFNEELSKQDVDIIPFHVCSIFEDVDDQYWLFSKLFSNLLDEHAPVKRKTITKNQVPYMNDKLRKEMYFRNKLKNNFFKNRTTHNWNLFNSQRNKVTSRQTDRQNIYFQNSISNTI